MERKKHQQRKRDYPVVHVRLREEDREWLNNYARENYQTVTALLGKMVLELRKQVEAKESQS